MHSHRYPRLHAPFAVPLSLGHSRSGVAGGIERAGLEHARTSHLSHLPIRCCVDSRECRAWEAEAPRRRAPLPECSHVLAALLSLSSLSLPLALPLPPPQSLTHPTRHPSSGMPPNTLARRHVESYPQLPSGPASLSGIHASVVRLAWDRAACLRARCRRPSRDAGARAILGARAGSRGQGCFGVGDKHATEDGRAWRDCGRGKAMHGCGDGSAMQVLSIAGTRRRGRWRRRRRCRCRRRRACPLSGAARRAGW